MERGNVRTTCLISSPKNSPCKNPHDYSRPSDPLQSTFCKQRVMEDFASVLGFGTPELSYRNKFRIYWLNSSREQIDD